MRTVILILLALMLVSSAANSEQREQNGIYWAGFLLFRVRCSAAGIAQQARINAIQQRANDLLTQNALDLASIKVVKSGNDALLYAGGRVLITVDTCTASQNKTSPMELAQRWANRMKEVYPLVKPKPRSEQ